MTTLIEELKNVEKNKQKTKELEQAIKEFITRPNVYDILRKAASKGITAKMNGDFTRLEAKKL